MDKSTQFLVPILLLMVGMCSTFAANRAWAQIYKWVDDQGVVNYSSQPPANRKAKELDTSAITVSVYEAPKPAQGAAATKSEVASLGNKIESLERQLEAERQARRYATDADARAFQTAYDQCVAQRGVDCNGIYNSFYPYWPVAVFVPRFHRFHVAPGFPMTTRNKPAGNVMPLSTFRPLAVARNHRSPMR